MNYQFQDVSGVQEETSRPSLEELDDHELLDLARDGSSAAYAVLYVRFRAVARRLARHLSPEADADDIVSETFAQIWSQLTRHRGPDRAFRAYLLTAVRHEAGRRARHRSRLRLTDDIEMIDRPVPFGGDGADSFERELVLKAFASLPERWRTVLWYVDVEGRRPQEVSEQLGLQPNSVSALVYRARAGLREAYVAQHVAAEGTSLAHACGDVRPRLASMVRRTAGARDRRRIHAHLQECADCWRAYVEVRNVNAMVPGRAGTTEPAAAAG